MIGLVIGIAAFLGVVTVVVVAPNSGYSPLVGGTTGMVLGVLVGVMVDEAIAIMHWFGPVDIPNPVIQIGDVATTLGTLYPVIFSLTGLVVGVAVAAIRKSK